MLQKLLLLSISILVLFGISSGYKHYQDRIPNGDRLPHPCKPNFIWHGVGHKNEAGGGDRNPFGLAFAENGRKWDNSLCRQDADRDGRTNGEELGDPDCIWEEGNTPDITDPSQLSHPGICEPLDDRDCIEFNDWEFCEYEEFNCTAFEAQGVQNVTLRFPETPVPVADTTYYCMAFRLPSDKEYHIIGSIPEIDNAYVMHHSVVWGCLNDVGEEVMEKFASPRPCDMVNQYCPSVLDLWTLGDPGYCPDEAYGYRMGSGGYTVAVLEYHWTNPELVEDYTDGSGMTLVYTEDLRENDASTIIVGPMFMEIPKQQSLVEYDGYCTSKCTSDYLNGTIYIAEFIPHMHYIGRRMDVEQWRDGSLYKVIASEPNYMYDSPVPVIFDPPVELEPGDEIKVHCEFNSMTRDEMTYAGPATSDEMCYAIMVYYPRYIDFHQCMTDKPGDPAFCGDYKFHDLDCNINEYLSVKFFEDLEYLTPICDETGQTCLPGCQDAIDTVMASDVCYSDGDISVIKLILFQQDYSRPLVLLLNSCYEGPTDAASSNAISLGIAVIFSIVSVVLKSV